MRKIFFFDLDGSLLDTAKGEYALPPKIINCIKLLRSNGNITSVCTARPKQFVKNNLPNIFDCYILLNGSYVEADNKILIDTPFSSEDLANITHRFNSLNISYILIGNYSCRACNISNSYKDILNQIYMSGQSYTHFSTSNEDKFYAIDLFFENDAEYEHVNSYMRSDKRVTINHFQGDFTADLSFIGKNKSLAIPYVLKYYGIDIADSFAFGDSLNDMDVFRLIPNTCAVANAVPDLKKCASYVSAKRVADGVLDGLRFWGYSQFK